MKLFADTAATSMADQLRDAGGRLGEAPLVGDELSVPIRWRFIREATAGSRFVDTSEDLDLFALRALAHQPMHVLARVSDDPAGAWRERDPDVVRRLAELELADVGLRPRTMPAA